MERSADAGRVQSAFRDAFPDGHLAVVSNREPYAHKRAEDGAIKVARPAGGLVLALDPVMRAVGGTWIAWGHENGDRLVVDAHDRVGVPPEDPAYTLRRVWLGEDEVDTYYLGYSNQALWPLCHNVLEHVRFRDRYWDGYQRVNGKFASVVLDEMAERDGLVWFHDYHLALAPGVVRAARPDLTLAHFWHIPWPAWETFRVCPQKTEILEGLLSCDLVGFHLDTFVTNFLSTCVRELGVFVDWTKRAIVYQGRMTHVRALPISIDVERFESMARSPETATRIDEIRRQHRLEGQRVGIGVDRLDYSKGLLERLEALRILFRDHPELIGRFTFIQVAVPTRSEIPAYQNLEEKVDRRIAELNAALGTGDWKPIVYIKTGLPQRELSALYRMADLAVISSVQDGMNLVVKEYIASQDDENPGAVCLSEFAGASDEMGHSILINPFNTEGFAEDLRRALDLPLERRKRSMAAMKATVREHSIHAWLADFMAAAGETRRELAPDRGG